MKQFRLSIAILLSVWSLAGTGVANADNGLVANGVSVEKSEQKKVRLYTKLGESVDVAIIDADGHILYKGVVAKNDAKATSFNLKGLPDGQYYLTASNDTYWMSQGLTIKGNALIIEDRNQQLLAQPTLTAYEKNKFEVNLPTKNVEEASVAIYDAQNVLVQTDAFKGSVRRFDLSGLPDGAYTFIVGPNQKQFTSSISIKH
ncbi:T9SS type A sorting domain-containing protein [Spirosoma endophyticum]|uniref:Por secretion system C-terminal sorting domain-containing protein n=1 Tax=Spirosoma endophyticum TaxID=662367 RepID=A0A1I1T1M7_9BACT|nr:hypothetical protein [Spirosoma endophyticum]SFD52546.1 hypothetical protein SAMN05216167_105312 [Spirosoma endophyticum]